MVLFHSRWLNHAGPSPIFQPGRKSRFRDSIRWNIFYASSRVRGLVGSPYTAWKARSGLRVSAASIINS